MTAEVAIMNTQGIALAADSAVTLGAGKTYNTADKLFALSRRHPVGIMIYSSASIMGIEWETIIKCYRDFLDVKSFDTLSEYAGDFINYLSKFPYFGEEKMQKYFERVCFDVFSHVLSWFLDDLHAECDGKENIEDASIDTVFNTSLKKIKEKMKSVDDEKQLKVDTDYIDANTEIINKMIPVVFENYRISKKQAAELVTILKLNFQKCGWIDDYTGIVIAGYGEREIFPCIHSFKVSGKLGKHLIYFEEDTDVIDGVDFTAAINPYAQTEMVHQFAKGIDPDFGVNIIEKVEQMLGAVSTLLPEADKAKTEPLTKLIADYIDAVIGSGYSGPILEIVACMQKTELVSMAEAMVNLTALKRHVSTDSETVGGPVDAALITKGDGFIWIKRKTNYDPVLNSHLNQSYFRGGRSENL
ncbi:hypothetical protein FACS1894137_15230 [Spirochaetia bacterium]|nr:hypothetical protein FACS1894137_15230 [Spirochaetia bacterium]